MVFKFMKLLHKAIFGNDYEFRVFNSRQLGNKCVLEIKVAL